MSVQVNRWSRVWLGVLPLLVAVVAARAAPPAPSLATGGVASLDLEIDREGDAEVYLWADGEAASAETFQRLAAAIPCQFVGAPEREDDDDGATLTGHCRGVLHRSGGLRSGRIDFRPFVAEVARLKGQFFEIELGLPRGGRADCPGWRRTFGPNADLRCSLSGESGVISPFAAPLAVDLAFGFGGVDLAWRSALLALVALIPLILLVRRRRLVLAAQGDERMTAWFGYWRLYRAAFQGSGLLWIALVLTLRLDAWIGLVAPSSLVRLAGQVLLLAGPPSAIFLLAARLSRPVIAHVREFSRPESERNLEDWGLLLARTVPLALIVLAWSNLEGNASLGLILAAFALAVLGRLLIVRATRLYPQALTTGALRDRIFELAGRAKARLNQAYVLPASRTRLANAFATQGNDILLTDYLLAHLSRREAEAVVAHELSHLRSRHPAKLGLALAVLLIGGSLLFNQDTAWVFSLLPSWLNRPPVLDLAVALSPLPLLLLAALLPFRLLSRRIERSADAGAARLTGDPEAMISALGKLARLNLAPLHWGRLSESLSTHPAMERRALALAKRFSVPAARALELLRTDAPGDGTSWELPATEVAEERIFTTRFKTRALIRSGWVTLLLAVGTVVAAAFWIGRMRLRGIAKAEAYTLAGALAVVACVLVANVLSPGALVTLRRQLAARLRQEGVEVEELGGIFAGFAPHGEPRLYEGYSSWDVGFLLLGPEGLVWLGDRIRFRLSRAEITAVRLGPGMPYFWPMPNLYVDWQGSDGIFRTFYLRAGARSFSAIRRETRALGSRLEAWRRTGTSGPDLPAKLAHLEPPITAEVTATDPRKSIRWRSVLAAAWLYGFLTLAACTLLGPVQEALPAALTAIGVMLALLLPNFAMRFRRQRRPVPLPSPGRGEGDGRGGQEE